MIIFSKISQKYLYFFFKNIFIILLVLFIFNSCDIDNKKFSVINSNITQIWSKVIYGDDDRSEYYEASTIEKTAADSVYIVVNNNDLINCNIGDDCTLDTTIYTNQSIFAPHGLCSDEPFREQPAIGFCSAFLVGTDLMATAGHCIENFQCNNVSFVPRFRIDSFDSPANVEIPKDEIYNCSSAVVDIESGYNDYAVWRLDRQVSGPAPLCICRSGTTTSGTDLVVIGYPYGLPQKVAAGAAVKDVFADFFTSNLDTYGGNSGSPVFDSDTMIVQGILVRGNADYIFDLSEGCYRSNTCSDSSGCNGTFEDVTHIIKIVDYVPDLVESRCQEPVLSVNTGLTVERGSSKIIAANQLEVTDAVTSPDDITFTVNVLPASGSLLLNGTPLVGSTFTQDDINNNIISYSNDSTSDSASDYFSFTVTDEGNFYLKETQFPITIIPQGTVNNYSPDVTELFEPLKGNTGIPASPTFKWYPTSDSDGDPITYSLFVCRQSDFTGCTPVTLPIAANKKISVFYASMVNIPGIILVICLIILSIIFSNRIFSIFFIIPFLIVSVLISGCGEDNYTGNYLTYSSKYSLDNKTTYYWKIKASDNKGKSSESETWSFTTL